MNDLQRLMDDISSWSDVTFGERQRNPAIAYHLKKETDELIDALNILSADDANDSAVKGEFHSKKNRAKMEYADCFMLLLDSASHAGVTAEELAEATWRKLEINKTRQWGRPDENGVIEHIHKSQ